MWWCIYDVFNRLNIFYLIQVDHQNLLAIILLMNNNEKNEIKLAIQELLELRSKEIEKNRFIEMPEIATEGFSESLVQKLKAKNDENTIEAFDVPLVRLNRLLKKADQFDEVLEIEKQMTKLHAKKFLTVKEFAEKYNIGKTSQQNYRGRLHDPLPYHQKVLGGKITYNVQEVEEWFENQHK